MIGGDKFSGKPGDWADVKTEIVSAIETRVVSGRPLRSRAVAGVSLHVCVGLGSVQASYAPFLPAAAAAAWRGRGRVPIAGWSYGGVRPERGLRGGGRRGWCEEWARSG